MQFRSVITQLSLLSATLLSAKPQYKTSLLTTTFLTSFLTAVTFSNPVSAESADIESLVKQPGVYTLTNLHPDEARTRLYSVNFQQAGLIPLCTEVEIIKASRKQIKFRIKDSGREYKYDQHRNAGEDLHVNAAKYFGKECNKDKVAKLSEIDQNGIKQGKALVGMSKQGVIYAIGYPPITKTPNLDAKNWKYWHNRFNTFDVVFGADDTVTRVMN